MKQTSMLASAVLTVAFLLGCSVHSASNRAVTGKPESRPPTVCLPPYWGGILAGVSTDSEVTRLLGKGHLFEDRGDTGARYFTDPSKSATLKIEYGTDRIVSLVELRQGLDASIPPGLADELVSEWVRPSQGVGTWWSIHLGDPEEAVRKNLGQPSEVRQDGLETVWSYESICACELATGLAFYFREGRLVAFSVWALMG